MHYHPGSGENSNNTCNADHHPVRTAAARKNPATTILRASDVSPKNRTTMLLIAKLAVPILLICMGTVALLSNLGAMSSRAHGEAYTGGVMLLLGIALTIVILLKARKK